MMNKPQEWKRQKYVCRERSVD